MHDPGGRHGTVIRLFNGPGRIGWLSVLLILIANGCATTTPSRSQPTISAAYDQQVGQALRSELQSWLGTPHRLGGMSRRGIDCSGLVVVLYDALFDLRLPRTTTDLIHTGQPVDKKNLMGGDLVFFKPGHKIRHVGIYLGHGEFAHTSTRGGVMISRLDDDFWRRCYLTGRRVL
jgi:probable lipoprotein NlpC